MSKLENYKGSIDLISGLRAKNNGDFPLMEAHDVQVTEEKRLDEMFSAPESWLPVYNGENEGGATGGGTGGGNYVLELSGNGGDFETGTLTDEQYQAVVDNFPNVVVSYENNFFSYSSTRLGNNFIFMGDYSKNLPPTADGLKKLIIFINQNKTYELYSNFSSVISGGLQVKQITFTDRPSLWAWLQSNYEKAIKTIVTLGANKYDLTENFIRIDVEDVSGFKGSIVQVGVDNNVTDIRFTYIYIADTFITANVGGSIFSIDGTSATVNGTNAQIVSDELWTSYGINVTITYIE